MALHPRDNVAEVCTDSVITEALRRVVAGQIGPRKPGVVYSTTDGVYEVLDVTTDRDEARRILRRRAAQFAVIVHDCTADTIGAVGTAWTGTDRVIKAVA
ncbi:hypothetical protein [Streptomyces sp. ML-6]|uniref:hypothetical protein n=1 Tax=Streptomyces sp. ML-6 TaxID=2982693 RepID=UPI0024C052EB|nr:hypothetical protein [Streptomyces sp. ML-6]MDK0524980.1 hypothetical protein [Streptomyces sp. ML-6]